MKILFLDIDGVLNSLDNMNSQALSCKSLSDTLKIKDEYGRLFDDRCVNWLRYIVDRTECKIVVSSSWRLMGLSNLQTMWEMRDLPGEIVGSTPNDASEYIINKYASGDTEIARGYEIQEYIDANNIKTYCIVDDDDDMLPHQKFVKTNSMYGIDGNVANKIVNILNSIDDGKVK